jgi:hypothetical protein
MHATSKTDDTAAASASPLYSSQVLYFSVDTGWWMSSSTVLIPESPDLCVFFWSAADSFGCRRSRVMVGP